MGLNDNGERVYKEGNNIALQVRKGIDEGRLRRALSTLGEKNPSLTNKKSGLFSGNRAMLLSNNLQAWRLSKRHDDPWNLESG
ncbi:hypothetical protein [Halomonas elongata]|uniref:Uncharacterized protein n=1 Tax=Halomonas elongata (strain ATCC 33173 / DSM 2581 / NBRC 15536 / NCIMB 2198 / 1H9) TaxID=768066 RepID=A0ABZ0T9C9_HALED|nr:hypothetical protein [Halomonas elongata]MDL4864273.1 hypothetical protein [Halomonas elongata]WBF17348.1 hypothetical protein LM502_14860 [Halomonas elongata]WPU46184.1 hypothetical protein SR933_13095 [Halomonas elongata DSM 2581]